MITKCFIVFYMSFFIFVEAKPLSSIAQDFSIIMNCNSTSPVDKKTLNVALIQKHFETDINESFKCFLHCLYYNYNWMSFYGVFNMEEMKSTLMESNLDEPSIEYLVSVCTELDIEDKCERAYLFTECFWTESDKLEQSAMIAEDGDLC